MYMFALIALVLSLPVYLLISIPFDEVVSSSYKAKCLSNNQYVVLQGSSKNEVWVFNEIELSKPEFETKQGLNFYCEYYDKIQPHITAYIESKNVSEQIKANENFFKFKDSVFSGVHSYPQLYELEVADEVIHPYKVYGPIIAWIVGVSLAFLLLQILKICYTYIVFDEVVLHPFRSGEN